MNSPAWDGDWPVTQLFGVNPQDYTLFHLAGHNGLDVGLPLWTRVYAPVDGVIAEVDYDAGGYGNYIKITTPDQQDWLLAHLSTTYDTQPGDEVVAGTPIGESGNTGNSTGPHLHIGWRIWNLPLYRGWPFNGYVDPRQQLDRLQSGHVGH